MRPLAAPVIDGLLRRGETANLVADPKVGKSWLSYGLAVAIATGHKWLDTFACPRGKVLIVDLELHEATCDHRLLQVIKQLDVTRHQLTGQFQMINLRGRLPYDLPRITSLLESRAGGWDLVIIDSLYRALPEGTTEADHARLTALYNSLDNTARQLNCAWLNIHHATKGNQAEKSVTDVGSGAGVQSRAVDSHIVLRRHEQEDVFVLEAAVRSFPPVQPLCVKWDYPLWQRDQAADPSRLRNVNNRQAALDDEGKVVLLNIVAGKKMTLSAFHKRTGMGKPRLQRLLAMLVREGRLTVRTARINGREAEQYRQPKN